VCRHLAYLGPQVPLGSLLVDPPWALFAQSWAPRQQQYGVVNADGFGVGWYAAGDPVPARYRRDRPIWADDSFADLARVVRSGAFLAAVRSASPGMAAGETAAAPFARGRWLFSHNGVLKGYPEAAAGLAASLPTDRLLSLEAPTDSALIWALVSVRLEAGAGLGESLAEVVAQVETQCDARLNLLLTDGREIAATVAGNSLAVLAAEGSVVVASEPFDDDPAWSDVPDRSLLVASIDDDGVAVTPL
jgi:gamma-glutamyl hercynylcysteine S-oxide hydrolase